LPAGQLLLVALLLPEGEETMTQQCTPNEANAIFICGEMAGLAWKLNVRIMEEYLTHPASDFKYLDLCRAAVEFAKVAQGEKSAQCQV
jgi:hypothetical protein